MHIVFDHKISLDIYAKTEFSTTFTIFKTSVLNNIEVSYPFITFHFPKGLFISIDSGLTYDGNPVRLELHVPQREALHGLNWTQGHFPDQPWVLFI